MPSRPGSPSRLESGSRKDQTLRALQTDVTHTIGRRPELQRGAISHYGTKPGDGPPRRRKKEKRPKPGSALPGLRWVPVPLAVLAALVGWLVLGLLQGQNGQNAAAHQRHINGFQAGGLALTVDQMLWMSNDMSNGPIKTRAGFSMPSSMMPGMQKTGENRLHLEFDLSNTTSSVQHYSLSEFRVVAPGGQTWKLSSTDVVGHAVPIETVLQPGFRTTVELYFDIPAKQSKNLTVKWSRGGTTVEFPVTTNGTVPGPHIH